MRELFVSPLKKQGWEGACVCVCVCVCMCGADSLTLAVEGNNIFNSVRVLYLKKVKLSKFARKVC